MSMRLSSNFLRKLSAAGARHEMRQSADDVERHIGRKVEHFCYPIGDATAAGPTEFAIARELGFKSAVTTRPGVLFPEHRDHLWALPRISLNGEFQRMRYVRVLTSGAAYLTDYRVVPSRLTPGFEKRFSARGMAWMYGVLGAAFTLAGAITARQRA
jgi:hypothetical protein